MRFEIKFLIIALLSLAIAVPVNAQQTNSKEQVQAQSHRVRVLQLQRQGDKLRYNKLQKELEQNKQLNTDQKKQIDELNVKLQAKAQEKARLAQVQAQAQQTAPVAVYARGGSCESYRGLVAQYSWNVNIALAIMRAESGCNPNAVSPTNDHGLMQLHGQAVYDPAANIAIAYAKYAARGWQPWTAYNTGSYLRFL